MSSSFGFSQDLKVVDFSTFHRPLPSLKKNPSKRDSFFKIFPGFANQKYHFIYASLHSKYNNLVTL